MGTPLAGVKVLELAVAVAGPAAAAVLADWGADVVKVEQAGDRSRQAYAGIARASTRRRRTSSRR